MLVWRIRSALYRVTGVRSKQTSGKAGGGAEKLSGVEHVGLFVKT